MYGFEELAAKIEWEGGIPEAIMYGVGHAEVPPEVQDLWKQAELLTKQLDFICCTIEARINEAIEDDLDWLLEDESDLDLTSLDDDDDDAYIPPPT